VSFARFGFGLVLSTAIIWLGCAQGSDSAFGEGGEGGVGGAGGASGPSSTSSAASTSGSTSTSSSSASTSGSTTASSSSGGPDCSAEQHLCGGVCTNNTPQTGCFTSVTCAPCASPPVNASSTCSADGKCDFSCTPGYMKSGNVCVCASECCSDADCGGGQVCQGNQCVAPPCDQAQCILDCFAQLCVGLCVGDMCVCQC
jgi:hypothetical protein